MFILLVFAILAAVIVLQATRENFGLYSTAGPDNSQEMWLSSVDQNVYQNDGPMPAPGY